MGDPRPGRSAADGYSFPDAPAKEADIWTGFPHWSTAEIRQLWELKDAGKSQTQIAKIMGRTIGATASKLLRTRPK